MTSGIYAVYDSDTDLPVYIGRSINIEKRIDDHLRDWGAASRSALSYGYIESPIIKNKLRTFAYLALSGRRFEWDVVEHVEGDVNLSIREAFWCNQAISHGIPICNGHGRQTMLGGLSKLPCPYTAQFGLSPTRYYQSPFEQERIPVKHIELVSRLHRESPDLYEQVCTGNLTANAAAIKAGFRKKKIQVEPTPEAVQRMLDRHLPGWRLVNEETGETV